MGAKKLPPVEEEYRGGDLGDERRDARLVRIGQRLEDEPSRGLPTLMGSDAELEAFYRFINNGAFDAEDILEPHVRRTLERCRAESVVLAIHDTTQFDFPGEDRDGLSYTTEGKNGFLAHVSLYASFNQSIPLGVGHVFTWTREKKLKRASRRVKVRGAEPPKESERWLEAAEAINDQAQSSGFEVVHVTDSEGDCFELMSLLVTSQSRFVIRAFQKARKVMHQGESKSLGEAILEAEPLSTRAINVQSRKQRVGGEAFAKRKKRNWSRNERSCSVSLSTVSVEFPRTRDTRGPGEPFQVNVVRVWEPAPPEGELPIEWILLTTEDVSSSDKACAIVDIYRKRWQIEEYFKALKTGCAFERRQVESYSALIKVLALFVPIAYRLLLLRGLGRDEPEADPLTVFSTEDLFLLANALPRPVPIPKTLREAILLLAQHGGHIKNNGPPGWLTLAQGYEKLLTLRLGWSLRDSAPVVINP
jgi:hypothetical protein